MLAQVTKHVAAVRASICKQVTFIVARVTAHARVDKRAAAASASIRKPTRRIAERAGLTVVPYTAAHKVDVQMVAVLALPASHCAEQGQQEIKFVAPLTTHVVGRIQQASNCAVLWTLIAARMA
jgi:hypothetical protein